MSLSGMMGCPSCCDSRLIGGLQYRAAYRVVAPFVEGGGERQRQAYAVTGQFDLHSFGDVT